MVSFVIVKTQLFFFLKLLGFWLLFFMFQRLLFVFHFFDDFQGSFSEVFILPFKALRLDLSAFAYLCAILFLLSTISFFLKRERHIKILNGIIRVYLWLMLLIVALIMSGEIVTYIEWKTKLSSKIFLHLNTPLEIFRTATLSYTFWFFFYVIVQLVFAWLIYAKWLKNNLLEITTQTIAKKIGYGLTYLLVGAFCIILMFRGGLQQIPVSATDAYFSNKKVVNDVSVNPVWNFIHTSYVHFKVDLSVYFNKLDPTESDEITAQLYETAASEKAAIFKVEKPNIVLVILEGWSGQMIAPLGGEKGITPKFNALCEEGLLFTEVYANGGTSETGNTSIMSGYPVIPGISISSESAKSRRLPSINKSLQPFGYSSFYTFGGSLSYGNIGAYLMDVDFDRVVDEANLNLNPTGKLGIHDEAMFPYFLDEIKVAERPYFYTLFTQSTHAPYDMPAESFAPYNDDYVTSMHYADEHLGRFAEELKQLSDFDNTIVVFIADHGRVNIYNENTYDEKYFHIPLLFWGGALANEYKGVKNNTIGGQSDFAKTLLNQLNVNTTEYHWSKDLLNPNTPKWSICTSTLSYGWKNVDGYTVYHMIDDRLIQSPYTNQIKIDSALKNCRAVLEAMYREFEAL